MGCALQILLAGTLPRTCCPSVLQALSCRGSHTDWSLARDVQHVLAECTRQAVSVGDRQDGAQLLEVAQSVLSLQPVVAKLCGLLSNQALHDLRQALRHVRPPTQAAVRVCPPTCSGSLAGQGPAA